MFRTVSYEPQWQDWYDTEDEAIEKVAYYTFEDYVAVVELKKVYRIKRDVEEVSIEEATQESWDKYNDMINRCGMEMDPQETPEVNE